ncbi:hypothetical protein AB1A81_12555 [Bdellovibrio bacteriovorus]|nr:hypothetical protein [Bdellovibrio bacteriovorus]AHZ85233.1 hypothetical protein EP01_09825 [Bdellovibrio bacteriovorus]BEV69125.1 hypothetical protein Bb109J_c2545 [Bdellovibrio bacteriovorus]
MKTIWVLSAVMVCSLDAHAIIPPEGLGAGEVAIRSNRSVRQQVESYTEMLEKEVSKAKNNKERYRAMNRIVLQIRSLRDNSVPQGAQDEAHMDLLVSVLESLPAEKKFKKKDCAKYEYELINQYEPTAEESPTEPAVLPGWKVLESLCQ